MAALLNPRRAPRAPARCHARVSHRSGTFDVETEDIGSYGCQFAAPQRLERGEGVALVVANDRLKAPLRIAGHVAWASAREPWRVGIAFAETELGASTRFMGRLFEAHPGLGACRRVPDRIPLDAMLYLAPPPRFVLDFTADEAVLLRAIASGASVHELQLRLRDRWPGVERALFSLLARQLVTLSRGASVHPDAWRRILAELEGAMAIESLARPLPPGAAEAFSRNTARPPPPAPPSPAMRPEAPAPTPPPISRESRAFARKIDAGDAWAGAHAPPHPDFAGAGVGWRQAGPRGAEAQGCLERALVEERAGHVSEAIALLRRALALAPGDPVIASALGRLVFRGRE